MSSLWNALTRKFRSVLFFACPFCATDYDYGPPQDSEEEPKREVYEPKQKHVRAKEKNKQNDVIVDEEAGFSSKSKGSDSQCLDVEVENSDEINRVLLRKSQFLPQQPYSPTAEEIQDDERIAELKAATIRRHTPEPIATDDKQDTEKRKTFTFKRNKKPSKSPSPVPISSPVPDDAISQTSKKSRKSIFSFKKKPKKPKKDGDNVSVFSFASFKSNRSVSSKSEAIDKKERKKRIKKEKKDKKQVEKQKLHLSSDLNQQKFENIYPWMNEIEPLDDEVPNLMEEIRIREAQEIYNAQYVEDRSNLPIFVDDKSYAAESFLDLGTQLVTELEDPGLPPLQKKFSVPEGTQKKPFQPSPLALPPESPSPEFARNQSPQPAHTGQRLRRLSSDPETEGIVRKARKSLADSVSEPAPPEPQLKKKDIFASMIPPNRLLSPKTPARASPIQILTPPTPADNVSTDEERDLKREIQEVTEREDFFLLSDRSQGDYRRKKARSEDRKKKRKERKRDKSEGSESKKRKAPARIESEHIEDRSIDDIPVIIEKNLAVDLTNPNLFPDSPEPLKESIPIVNYTRNWESNVKENTDKAESIKEIQKTIDRSNATPDNRKDVDEKIHNNEGNSTTRVVIDESLKQHSANLFRENEESNILSDSSAKSNKKKRRKQHSRSESKENREEKRRRRKAESEERRRQRRSETDEERSERKARRKNKKKRKNYSESDVYQPMAVPSEQVIVDWVSPAQKMAENSDQKKKQKRKKEKQRSDLKMDIGSPDSNTFSRDIPLVFDHNSPDRRMSSPDRRMSSPDRRMSSPDRRMSSPDRRMSSPDRRMSSPDRRMSSPDRRKSSPDRRISSPEPSTVDKRGQNMQLEILRQKMDLDFQSVDTKRSLFIVDGNPGTSIQSSNASDAKSKKKEKTRKKNKVPLPPAPKRRVSARPSLDPLVSQEEANIPRRRPEVIAEEENSGSTLHSGDRKQRSPVRRASSFKSNDSTLHDIDDIPSMWNVSVRSRQISMDSADSRITHRSQLSVRSGRNAAPTPDPKNKKKKKKSKK